MSSALPNSDSLAGRVALVCGATGSIGEAIVRGLAELGAGVAVHCHRRRDRAQEIVDALPAGARHAVVQGDLAESAEAARVVEAVAGLLGSAPTIVVNAAYPSMPPRVVRDSSDDDLMGHLAGFRTHVNICRAAVPGMRAAGSGRIILISGALASRPFPGFALYGAMKAGLTTFSRTLALEEGTAGITVNVVAPGRVETPEEEPPPDLDPAYEALDAVMRLRMALAQMATPEDVAATVCFLATPQAGAVTGQVVYLAAGEPI
jgi:3-oxoacyl-[acyl-carrier protein] reductase